MSKEVNLIPYLNFEGNCEDALNSYAKILDGKVEIMQRYDNPAMQAPESYRSKVLHARFHFGNNEIYASDVFPGQNLGYGRAVAMSLSFSDLEQAKQVFRMLSEGGEINVPFEKQFWGDWHGNLVDRFGTYWMVNVELNL